MKKQVIQKFIYQLTRVCLILGWFISGSIRLTNHEILVELSLIEPILSPGATIELNRLNGSTQHFREPTHESISRVPSPAQTTLKSCSLDISELRNLFIELQVMKLARLKDLKDRKGPEVYGTQGFTADPVYGRAKCLPMLGSLKT